MTVLDHDWFPRPLPDTVTIGERSWLYSSYACHHNRGRITIGADCGIYNGTQFELGPQGEVQIGDFSTLVGAIIATNGSVSIADHVFIAHEVFIAASPWAQPPCGARGPLATSTGATDAPVVIDSGAWIGTRAVILAPARIGRDAIIGAGTVVSGVVPDGATASGNPAQVRVRR